MNTSIELSSDELVKLRESIESDLVEVLDIRDDSAPDVLLSNGMSNSFQVPQCPSWAYCNTMHCQTRQSCAS